VVKGWELKLEGWLSTSLCWDCVKSDSLGRSGTPLFFDDERNSYACVLNAWGCRRLSTFLRSSLLFLCLMSGMAVVKKPRLEATFTNTERE